MEKPILGTNTIWSGSQQLPDIGDRVYVNMNDLGYGIVMDYKLFKGTDNFYVAIGVLFENPPTWYIAQNGNNKNHIGYVFGMEVGDGKS